MDTEKGFTLIVLLFVFLLIGIGIIFSVTKISKTLLAQGETELLDDALPVQEQQLETQNELAETDDMNKIDQSPTPTLNNSISLTLTPTPTSIPASTNYLVHRGITATVFWVGEPVGNGSSEDNALSAWDDNWQESFGGYDDPYGRNGYYPEGFTPLENPFYLDLPYNDFDDAGVRRSNAYEVVPWANQRKWGDRESMMKNRWVKLSRNGIVCYGQIQDAGPYEYNDYEYVFGNAKPKNTLANNAGMDVSPALRDCLAFEGLNNAENVVDWQFVEDQDVPDGPWKKIITTSQVNWK